MKSNISSILLIALATLAQVNALSITKSNVQIIAQFPQGIWSFENGGCDPTILRKLPARCHAALNENSSDSEKLACFLITAPGNPGPIPFGMYPSSMMLTTNTETLSSEKLTKVFGDCAMARMIDDGCFNFSPDTWTGGMTQSSYSSIEEYQKSVENAFGIEVSATASIENVAVRAGANSDTADNNNGDTLFKTAGLSLSYYNNVGTLSLGKCAADYVDADLEDAYYQFMHGYTTDFVSWALDKEPKFVDLVQKGFFVPTQWSFGVSFKSNVNVQYEETATGAGSLISQSMNAGLDISLKNSSGSFAMGLAQNIGNQASSHNLNVKVNGQESKYGLCDFQNMKPDDVDGSLLELQDCASEASHDVLKLDRPTRIPSGGFRTIIDILSEKDDIITGRVRYLTAAANVYFGTCGCDVKTRQYRCYLGDGTFAYAATASDACEKSMWWMIDDAQVDTFREQIRLAAEP